MTGDDAQDGVSWAKSVIAFQDIVDSASVFASREVMTVPFGQNESIPYGEIAIVLAQLEGFPSLRDGLEKFRHDFQSVFHDGAYAIGGLSFSPWRNLFRNLYLHPREGNIDVTYIPYENRRGGDLPPPCHGSFMIVEPV